MTAAKILEIKVQASKLQETLGMLAETQSQLNAINRALEEATEETKKSGSTLSKAFDSVCKKMKDFALTIKKGVLGGLKDSLKVARNLVMALGAAAASAIAISSGAIQRDREAKDSKVSASQLLAYQYAQEQSGMDASEFNLANLQAHIGDIRSAGLFGALGLTQHELEGLNGYDAMQKVIEAVQKKGGANMTTGTYNGLQEAISTLLGVTSRERMHLFSDKKQNEFKGHYQWGVANGIDNDTLKKGEQAWNKFMFVMRRIGMELASVMLPSAIKGLEMLADAAHKFMQWLKGDAGKNARESLIKIMDSLMGIAKTAMPYFLVGLSALGEILKVINETLSGGPLGKTIGKMIDYVGGTLGEWAAQWANFFSGDTRGWDTHGKDKNGNWKGSGADSLEASLAQTRRWGISADQRAIEGKAAHYIHGNNLYDKKPSQNSPKVVVNVHNTANSDGTITSNVSSKIGGR